MKLFHFEQKTDWGMDYYFSFLKTSKYTFLQVCLSLCETAEWPYLQISMGQNSLLGIFFYFYKFGADFDILGKTWRD